MAPADRAEWVSEILMRKTASLLRNAGCQPVKANGRTSFRIPGYFDLPPADASRPGQGLHGFVNGLLGRDPGCRVSGRVGATGQILALVIGEESVHCLLALVREEVADPLEIHQVNPHSNEGHR